MGNYNPHVPQNLGNEWVGIRDEDIQFSPVVNAYEIGTGFTLATARQIGDARFYIHEWPPGEAVGQAHMVSIYPQGQEDNAGPVRRVVIPCNAGGITGGNVNYYGGATTLAQAFADPSDSSGVSMASTFGGGSNYFNANFPTASYQNELSGKRILGLNVLYALAGEIDDVSFDLGIYNNANLGSVYGTTDDGSIYGNSTSSSVLTSATPQEISRLFTGEINPLWSTTLSPNNTSERQPWDYTGLARFEFASANRLQVRGTISNQSVAGLSFFITIEYLALEIFYCEERRVAIGARAFGYSSINTSRYRPYVWGANSVPMRDVSQVANPVLPAGAYTAVISAPEQGGFYTSVGHSVSATKFPVINALRELYAIPPHPGLQINLPFPKTPAIVGRTLTSETTHVLPQLSIHTTGGTVLTEPHVYGRRVAAPVYGSIVATQGIINAAVGAVPTNYPQVRFWARRFGDTTVALDLHNQSGSPAWSASITPAAFDALPEILDGWKEVNLTFTGPTPSFTAAGTATTVEWSAVGEVAGNRWEVLGVTAPALSGIPGNLLQTVPSGQVLDSATYGGATAFLAWLQPNSGATASDTTSDASIIFAQDMPTVSGVAITLTSQLVSGIGLNCGLPPGCIPTGIGFHTVSWVSLATQYGAGSAPITGFGYYEIQRMDTIDTWATIAQVSTVASTSFLDYEPRVGILSSYRIRACDSYEFCGPWSSTVTATLPAPGVYGTDGNGVLIFTCNSVQSGAINLAYTQQWETNKPEDAFEFPEAGNVKLQEFYGQDFVTAFRPLERGGERFDATVLVQAAAVSPPVLENVFHSLRDMAWEDVPQICVRNELGDRWFATVIVPDGRVRRNRRLQLAKLQVIEVADTPVVVEL
jgi:hypothetical protein